MDDYYKRLTDMRSDEVFNELWSDTLELDPVVPRERTASSRINAMTGYSVSTNTSISKETAMKGLLFSVIDILQTELTTRFSDLKNYKWMELFQPDKFQTHKTNLTGVKQMIIGLKEAHPFLVPDSVSFMNQLNILYTDSQMADDITK